MTRKTKDRIKALVFVIVLALGWNYCYANAQDSRVLANDDDAMKAGCGG